MSHKMITERILFTFSKHFINYFREMLVKELHAPVHISYICVYTFHFKDSYEYDIHVREIKTFKVSFFKIFI